MKKEKAIAMRLNQDIYDYYLKLSIENRTTFSHELHQVLFNAIKDKLKK